MTVTGKLDILLPLRKGEMFLCKHVVGFLRYMTSVIR